MIPFKEQIDYIMNISNNTGIFTIDSGMTGPNILISFLIHGNEYCGLDTVYKLLTNFELKTLITTGKITFVLGNIESSYQGTRFVEKDMNRIRDLEGDSYEHNRAREIIKIIHSCDICIDLHSTKKDSGPFLFSFAQENDNISGLIDGNYIIYDAEQFVHGKTFASYCVEGLGAKNAFVFEMGQHENHVTFEKTYNNIITILNYYYGDKFPVTNHNHYKTKKLTIVSAIHAKTLETKFLYTDSPKSFDFIPKDTIICFDGEKYIVSNEDCYIVLPSIPEYIGREIGYIALEK